MQHKIVKRLTSCRYLHTPHLTSCCGAKQTMLTMVLIHTILFVRSVYEAQLAPIVCQIIHWPCTMMKKPSMVTRQTCVWRVVPWWHVVRRVVRPSRSCQIDNKTQNRTIITITITMEVNIRIRYQTTTSHHNNHHHQITTLTLSHNSIRHLLVSMTITTHKTNTVCLQTRPHHHLSSLCMVSLFTTISHLACHNHSTTPVNHRHCKKKFREVKNYKLCF